MNRRAVDRALRVAFEKWVDSISDKSVRSAAICGGFITGGAIASLLIGEEVRDFDIYFKSTKDADIVLRHYLASSPKFKDLEAGFLSDGSGLLLTKKIGETDYVRYSETYDSPESDMAPCVVSSNAVTLKGGYQLVHRFCGPPDAIDDSFDFAHCSNYWSVESGLVLRPKALESIVTRDLLYTGSKYPICSLVRLRKFLGRGWLASAGQMLKIALDIASLDLSDINVLRDQLEGVDVAYFQEVVRAMEEKNVQHIDKAAIIEILDRLH